MQDYEELKWMIDELSTILTTKNLKQHWRGVQCMMETIRNDKRLSKEDFRIRIALENLDYMKSEIEAYPNALKEMAPFFELIYQSHQMLEHYFVGMEAKQFAAADSKKPSKKKRAA
jgi:hypothetical protein